MSFHYINYSTRVIIQTYFTLKKHVILFHWNFCSFCPQKNRLKKTKKKFFNSLSYLSVTYLRFLRWSLFWLKFLIVFLFPFPLLRFNHLLSNFLQLILVVAMLSIVVIFCWIIMYLPKPYDLKLMILESQNPGISQPLVLCHIELEILFAS